MGFECVLADMGLARLYDREEQYQKTKTATMPLKWSAPELLKDKKYSFQSDIWSYGIVSIEVLTRSLPYPDLSPLQAAMGVAAGSVVPTIPSQTPDFFKGIFPKFFARDPRERPLTEEILLLFNNNV